MCATTIASAPRFISASMEPRSGPSVTGSRSYNRTRTPARRAAAARSTQAYPGIPTTPSTPAESRSASTSADVPLSVSMTLRAL